MQGAYYQENLAWEKLTFADQINPVSGTINNNSNETPPDNNQISTVDFGAGLLFGYEDAFLLVLQLIILRSPSLVFMKRSPFRSI